GSDMRALPRAVSAAPLGQRIPIEGIRRREPRTFWVELVELEEPRPPPPTRPAAGVERYGLSVQELTPELRARLGIEDEEPGLVVAGVEPGGAAARAGLLRGDRILEAGQRPVRGIEDFARALEAGDGSTLLLLQRPDGNLFVVLARSRG